MGEQGLKIFQTSETAPPATSNLDGGDEAIDLRNKKFGLR